MRDVVTTPDPDLEADRVAARADTALPRAIGSVCRCVCKIDGAQLGLNLSGRTLTPVAERLRRPDDYSAAKAMTRLLFAPAPKISAPRRQLA